MVWMEFTSLNTLFMVYTLLWVLYVLRFLFIFLALWVCLWLWITVEKLMLRLICAIALYHVRYWGFSSLVQVWLIIVCVVFIFWVVGISDLLSCPQIFQLIKQKTFCSLRFSWKWVGQLIFTFRLERFYQNNDLFISRLLVSYIFNILVHLMRSWKKTELKIWWTRQNFATLDVLRYEILMILKYFLREFDLISLLLD